ncbi:MAG: hypothetical protein AAF236_07125 [Verrucomicrobiota bacterium]
MQPLDAELGYYFTPGWNSAWGAFLLNEYGFEVNEDILGRAHLDVRSERGIAGGVEFSSRKWKGNEAIGRLNLYYARDNNPQIRFNGEERLAGTPENRYRINLQHRVFFPGSEDETFYVDFDINKLSDRFFYEDFAPSEFRIDPKPDNIVNLVKRFPQAEVSLLWRGQLNDFFQTDTRSPELSIDVIRTPLGETGFFYDGFTSYGILGEELDEDEVLAGIVEPSGYNRFQTYHEVLFPAQVGGFLNVVPRAGFGYSNYSDFDISGLDSFDRTTFTAGLDLSFKLSKRSPNVYNRRLGLDGLLHVVQPYLNYSYLNTDEINGRFTPIDRLTPTTRLRPIDLPLFNGIDDVRDWHIVRAGVSNRWYTRRDGVSYEWLSINNYIDGYIKDPELNRDFSNLFTEIDWRPVPWLTASTRAQFPILDDQVNFSEIQTYLTVLPTDWFSFSFGHYFLNDHPFFADTDLYTLNTYTRINDNWGFSTAHRFEADDGTLEYQQYSVHRDLASWTASVGAIIRDNRDGQNEYGVLLSLTLKAFPRVRIPVDFQPGGLGAEN